MFVRGAGVDYRRAGAAIVALVLAAVGVYGVLAELRSIVQRVALKQIDRDLRSLTAYEAQLSSERRHAATPLGRSSCGS